MAQENIDVTVDLHDQLSRPANKARDSIEDLGDEVRELDGHTTKTAASNQKLEKSMRALHAASGKTSSELKGTNAELGRTSKASKLLSVVAGAAGGGIGKLGTALGGLGANASKGSKGLKVMRGLIFGLLKVQAVVLLVTLLAGALSALGAAAFAGVAGLSPLVGLLGVLPGLVLTAVAGVAAAKLGFKGIGEAMKALGEGDPVKIAESMGKLTGQGRRLALTLDSLVSGPLRDMQQRTQQAIAPGFIDGLQQVRPLLPVIQKGLAGTGRTLGMLASMAGRATNNPIFRGQLSRVMATNNQTLLDGGRAAGVFGLAMLNIADAFAPVQREMGSYLLRGAEFIRQSTDMGLASGGLETFFRNAWTLAKGVGQVLADVSVALYNTGVAGASMSAALGGGILGLTARWRAWTESVGGQNAIRDWFSEATPVVMGFLGLLGDLGSAFGGLSSRSELAPLISQIRSELGPALSDLSATASSELGPALITAATAAVKFVTALSGSPLPEMLAGVATIVLGITSAFTSLPGPVQTAVLAVGALLTVMKLLGVTAAFLRGGAIAGMFSAIVTGARAGMIGTQGLATAFGAVRGAAMGASIAVGATSALLTGGISLAIVGITTVIGKWVGANSEAKASVDGLVASLDQQTGAITKGTAEYAARLLQDKDLLKTAGELGVSQKTIVDATLGRADAQEKLNSALDAMSEDALGYQVAEDYRRGFEEVGALVSDATAKQREFNKAVNGDFTAGQAAMVAQWGQADAANKTARELAAQEAATRGVTAATRELSTVLDQRGTWVAFRQAILNTVAALKDIDVSAALNKNRTALNLNTQAGIDTFTTFSDLATAASKVKNAAQRNKAFDEVAASIRKWGTNAGMSKPAVQALVDTFVNVEKSAKRARDEAGKPIKPSGYAPPTMAGAPPKQGAVIDVTVEDTGAIDSLAQLTGYVAQVPKKVPIQATAVVAGAVNPLLGLAATALRVPTNVNTKAAADTGGAVKGLNDVTGAAKAVPGKTDTKSNADTAKATTGLKAVGDAARNIPNSTNTNVNVNTGDAVARIQAIANRLFDLDGQTATTQIITRSFGERRRDGGPVWSGTQFTVGEAGPELFIGANSGVMSVIGRTGQETRHFPEPGMVLPNESYRDRGMQRLLAAQAMASDVSGGVSGVQDVSDTPVVTVSRPEPPGPPTPPADGGGGDAPPPIHLHFHGDGGGIDLADVRREALSAWRQFERERKERG